MIELQNVGFQYQDRAQRSISGNSCTAGASEVIVIAGESGCGKSTLLRRINGLCPRFYEGTADARLCIGLGAAMAACLALQALCAYASDRLQASTGYLIMADKRVELGAHLRRMPMGYFTEGAIGKISSVLSTDMVFIEETVTPPSPISWATCSRWQSCSSCSRG